MEAAKAKEYARKVLRARGHERPKAPAPSPRGAERRIHFLHIGKNAGSQVAAITRQINRQNVGVEFVKHGHHVFLRDIPKDAEYFFSIRNPVSRFVSGFYSRKRMGQPKFHKEWNRYEVQAFADFEHANDLAEALFAEGRRGVQAFAAIKSINHTAMNQVDWFYGCGNIFTVRPPVWVIRQESFEEDMATFYGRLGLDGRFRILDDPVKAHRNDYSDIPALSERAIENLKSWYAQDFEFYRACEQWIADNSDDLQSSPSDS